VAAVLGVVVVIPLGLLARIGWPPVIGVDQAVSDVLVVPGHGIGVDILGVLTAGGLPMARLLVLGPLSVWLAWRQWWRLFWLVVVGGALVGPLNHVLKVIFDRPRPDYDGTIEMDGLSYPSGHAAGAAAVATILLVVFWPLLSRAGRLRLVVLAIVGAAVVGYTRVALGAHFASDVVAGWCVGITWILLLAVVLRVWLGQPDTSPGYRRVTHRHRQPSRSSPAPSYSRAAAPGAQKAKDTRAKPRGPQQSRVASAADQGCYNRERPH
jgi:membrane-associated phospholipid phosphatase